tara:strand:+ start:93 stop:785 length:693 start_codon:yes stop_codon:yes gene_type:complete
MSTNQFNNSRGGELISTNDKNVLTIKFPIDTNFIVEQLNNRLDKYRHEIFLPDKINIWEEGTNLKFKITDATKWWWVKENYEFYKSLECGEDELYFLNQGLSSQMNDYNTMGELDIIEDMLKVARILCDIQRYGASSLWELEDDWDFVKDYVENFDPQYPHSIGRMFSNMETKSEYMENKFLEFIKKYKGDVEDYYVRKVQQRWKEKLYNPHTELGKRFALKQIEWAFEE